MELNHDISNGITTLSQSQYIKKILERYRMANSQPIKMPIDSNMTLPWTYPDIAHAVGMVLRHAATSEQAHMTTVKRIFHYL